MVLLDTMSTYVKIILSNMTINKKRSPFVHFCQAIEILLDKMSTYVKNTLSNMTVNKKRSPFVHFCQAMSLFLIKNKNSSQTSSKTKTSPKLSNFFAEAILQSYLRSCCRSMSTEKYSHFLSTPLLTSRMPQPSHHLLFQTKKKKRSWVSMALPHYQSPPFTGGCELLDSNTRLARNIIL